MGKNIYAKMQELRLAIASIKMEKSGNNKFAGYKYFELQDFMPHVIEECSKLQILGQITFTEEVVTLTVVDLEDLNMKAIYTMPMSSANLKGCHAVQNVGAVMTYSRRYLWSCALGLTDADPLDSTTGKKDSIETEPVLTKVEQELAKKVATAKTDVENSYTTLRKLLKTAKATNKYLGMTKEELSDILKSNDSTKLKALETSIDEGIVKVKELQAVVVEEEVVQ